MVKRKGKVEAEVVGEVEPMVAAEVVVGAGAEEKKKRKRKPRYKRHDLVGVRVLAEMGILAGKVVWKGELHQVRYWQYLEARETGGEGYLLVE